MHNHEDSPDHDWIRKGCALSLALLILVLISTVGFVWWITTAISISQQE